MSKNIIPIVFAFDKNYIEPALVTIFSLLDNAKEETFYDVWVFSNDLDDNSNFLKLQELYDKNCKINFYDPKDAFQDAHKEKYWTTPTYYRFLIPEVLKDYDKAIWCDVDIIVKNDLSEVFNIDISKYYVAGVSDFSLNYFLWPDVLEHIEKLGLSYTKYINAGFIVLNLSAFRENNLVEKAVNLIYNNKFKFLDQDALNIVCKDKVYLLHQKYNFNEFKIEACSIIEKEKYTNKEELDKFREELLDIYTDFDKVYIFHYILNKPWGYFKKVVSKDDPMSLHNCIILFEEIWWGYYKKSPFFSNERYMNYILEKSQFYLDFNNQISLMEKSYTRKSYSEIEKDILDMELKYQKLWKNDWVKFGRRSFMGKVLFLLIYPFKKILKR